METLKLSFVIGALALASGCVGTDKTGNDTGTSTTGTTDSKDSGKDSGTDSGTTDSGTTDSGTTTTGTFVVASLVGADISEGYGKYGIGYYSYDYANNVIDASQYVCYSYIELKAGDTLADCADCEFSYSLQSDSGYGNDGSDCQTLLDSGVGAADASALAGSWGPGATYDVGQTGFGYTSNHPKYNIPVVFSYSTQNQSWGVIGYQYEATGNSVSGAGNTINFTRQLLDAYGYAAYYYPVY